MEVLGILLEDLLKIGHRLEFELFCNYLGPFPCFIKDFQYKYDSGFSLQDNFLIE